MLDNHAIGFTDVAKRVSAMGHELRAVDFKTDAPKLREKIERYAPELVWFHGKVAMNKFMFYSYGIKKNWQWGFNLVDAMESKIFVTPNPSPANAAYSLDMLVDYYKELRCY